MSQVDDWSDKEKWSAIDRLLAVPLRSVFAAGPVGASRMAEIERDLGAKLPKTYREFLMRYGRLALPPTEVHGVSGPQLGARFMEISLEMKADKWLNDEQIAVVCNERSTVVLNLARQSKNDEVWVEEFEHPTNPAEAEPTSEFETFLDFLFHRVVEWVYQVNTEEQYRRAFEGLNTR